MYHQILRLSKRAYKLIEETQAEQQLIQEASVKCNPYNIPELFGEFLTECCRIRSGNKIVPFLPYEYQTELSKVIDRHRGAIVYKTRQMGCTETIAAKFLHKALLNPAYASVVLSIGQAESSNVAIRIQNMPAKVEGLKFLTKSKTEVQPEGAGKIWFRPSTDNAARSLESVSDIFFDEAAFPDNFEELYTSSAPTQEAVGDDARTIIASTMSEMGKLSRFWQMFDMDNPVDAEEMVHRVKNGQEEPFTYWVDSSGWAKVIIHWKAHPIYSSFPDYLARTKKKHKLTEDKLQREYNLGIPSAGGSLFHPAAIDACANGRWTEPKPKRHYMSCTDPNFGGDDFWITQIWDITEYPIALVAEYAEQGRNTTYCLSKAINLIDRYKCLLNVIEQNSGGIVVAEQFLRIKPNLRLETVNTTSVSKRQNTDRIALAIEDGSVSYPSDWAGINEMRNFSNVHRKALSGHDDRVMAWAIGFAWLDEALELIKTATKVRVNIPATKKFNNPFK